VGSRSHKAEIGWWLGLAAWVTLAALWEPEPPLSYLDAPSTSTRPDGYAVFHDLVGRNTAGARRLLGGVSQVGDGVGVLVVLSPSRGIDDRDREEMLDWVSSTGGTLIIGHPIRDDEGNAVDRFGDEGFFELSARGESPPVSVSLSYLPRRADPPREVPTFEATVRGEIALSEIGAEAMVTDGEGRTIVSTESHGAGTVIQLADATMLDNSELGFKRAHLFAAALIDEAGKEKLWAFDEAHEGVEPEPSLVAYLGSGPWRGVLLQVLLLGLFVYWWASARLVRPTPAPPSRRAREVTTLARDVGDFYLRAGRSEWALSRVLEHLRRAMKGRGRGEERQAAEDVAAEAARELDTGGRNAERHVVLIRKMAICQRMLAESSKGKKR
jgi:hypothetical protein